MATQDSSIKARQETAAEMALRSLASWLGVGGYNAASVDPVLFEKRIREEIDRLPEAANLDAIRYRKLRALGCAPADAPQLENGTVLRYTNLDEHMDAYLPAVMLDDAPKLLDRLQSALLLLERCGPHLQGTERECCGNGQWSGHPDEPPECCGQATDLSDHVLNEVRTIRETIAAAKEQA